MSTTFTNLLFHVVYSTKYRRQLIKPDLRGELYRYIGGIIRDRKGILLEIGGTADHIHLLAKFSPTIAVSDMLKLIKANSSKWANDAGKWQRPFAWQTGYAAFSVSHSRVDSVRQYVRTQEEHHRRLSFQEEFIKLLEKHKIEYDAKYLWEKEHVV